MREVVEADHSPVRHVREVVEVDLALNDLDLLTFLWSFLHALPTNQIDVLRGQQQISLRHLSKNDDNS